MTNKREIEILTYDELFAKVYETLDTIDDEMLVEVAKVLYGNVTVNLDNDEYITIDYTMVN